MRIDLVGWSLLLIALAMGYSACVKANKETNQILKIAGYVIGIIILAASLLLALGEASTNMRRKNMMPRRGADLTRPTMLPRENMPNLPAFPRAPKALEIPKPPSVKAPAPVKAPALPVAPVIAPAPPAAPAKP